MQNPRVWKKVWFVLALLVLGMLLSSCGSMEEKRDKFMAQGKASYEKGDYVTARLHFKNALQLDPNLAEGYLWLGKTELRLKNPRGAFGSFSKAVELKPEWLEAQVMLGNLFLLGKKTDEAEAKVKLVLGKDPSNTGALMLSAGVALAKKQPQAAQEILKKIIILNPHKVEAYLMHSAIDLRQQKPEEAAVTLDEGIKANPQAVALYLARARLAEKQKQLDQAETILNKAEKVDPQNIQIQDELVRLYSLKKEGDRVEAALRRKIALEPDEEDHVGALAQFLSSRGRFAEGEQALKDFIAKHPEDQQAKFDLANFYLANQKFGRGERILKEIIKKDPVGPSGIKAKGEMAVLRLAQGNREEAEKLVAEVLKENPNDMTALKLQGLIALSQKDGLKAVSNFRILTQDQPQNQENWLLLARAHQINNEKQLAKEAAKKALDLKPDYTEARTFLYGIYLQDEDYDDLIKLIKEYLRADEKNLANWSALGDVYVRKGEDKKARVAFQRMIDLEPQDPQGYIKMALLSQKNKQPEEAARYLKAALKQNPNYPTLRLLLALYQKEKQPDKALEAARAAVAQAPKNAELHQILGEVLLVQNQPEAAAAALEEALTLNPNDAAALGLLIRAYHECPDKTERIRKLQQKAEDPQAPIFYALALAQFYENQQQGDKAIALYDRLLERPGSPAVMVKNNLAYLLAQYQPSPENLERAQRIATEILDDNPLDPRLLDTLGWIYCRQKNYTEAKKYLKQAVDRAPDHPVLQYHLGFCAAKLGDTAVARQALEKALASKNSFEEREAAQKLLESLSEGEK